MPRTKTSKRPSAFWPTATSLVSEPPKESGIPGIQRELGFQKVFALAGGIRGVYVLEARYRCLIDYIKGQQEHRRKTTFEEECRKLLLEAGMQFDERYQHTNAWERCP